MNLRAKFENSINNVKTIVQRYPYVLLSALVTAISLIRVSYFEMFNYNERENYTSEIFTSAKTAIVAGLGISLLFGLTMLAERLQKKWLPMVGVAFLTLFYFLFFPSNEDDMFSYHFIVLVVVFILFHLMVAFLPFLKSEKEEKFWEYNKKLFLNFILAILFCGVLTAGVELAMVAFKELLYIGFDDDNYLYVFQFLAIFGSCFIFLLFVEGGLPYLEKEEKYPVVLKFFTQYILIPLLLLYLGILYVYFGKIVITQVIPKGWVSYLVIAYGIVGILAYLLVYPLEKLKAQSWVRSFSKIFFISLLPLLALLYVSIFMRINQYGITENRYYVLSFAIWLTLMALYFIYKKEDNIKWIPMSLFIIGLFSLVFPYLNVFSTSYRSQEKELITILSENKLLQSGKIDFAKPIQDSIFNDVCDKFDYLEERHQKDFLLSITPKENQPKMDSLLSRKYFYARDIKMFFSEIIYTPNDINNRNISFGHYQNNQVVNVRGYTYFLSQVFINHKLVVDKELSLEIKTNNQDVKDDQIYLDLVITNDSVTKKESLLPFYNEMVSKYENNQKNISKEEMEYPFDLNGCRGILIIKHVNRYYSTDDTSKIHLNTDVLLEKN